MTSRRALTLPFVLACCVVVAVVLTSPVSRLALHVAMEEFHPAAISWEGKTAWKRCDSVIAGETSWPQSPQAACAAMHLCANEAPLTEPQKQRLAQLIKGIPACQDP